eukprot:15330529-Ditylum_brightwellii.AAC.1
MKHKARICAHGGMQQWGLDFQETFSPVVMWITVRTLLTIALIHDLPTHALKEKGRYFKPSQVDPCLFIKKDIAVLTYVDDVLIIDTIKQSISGFIKSLKEGDENLEFTEEGTMEYYLGVMIRRSGKKNGRCFELCQPYLIKKFVELVGLSESVGVRDTPVGLLLLHKDLKGQKMKQSWNYRSAVGMSSYIQGSTRLETLMAVHQCARFTNALMLSHERAIRRIEKYLTGTADQ